MIIFSFSQKGNQDMLASLTCVRNLVALKGKWALKWVLCCLFQFWLNWNFQHPREDVIEVVCITAVIIISVQFSELEYHQHFI